MSSFRVLQFNMQFGQVWDDADPDHAPINLDATIAEIRAHDADVILLQEVENAPDDGGQSEPPPNYQRLVAALPEYDSYFSYPKLDPRELPFGFGLAIFSKTPLRETWKEDLKSEPVEFDFFGTLMTPTDRIVIGAETTISGRDVRILNTHLLAYFMLKTSSEVHGGQRARLAEILRAKDMPTILGGDFNVRQHESLIAQYGRIGYSTVQDSELTWRRMPYLLDHLFYPKSLRCVGHQVVQTMASDHLPIVGDFEFVDGA